MKSYLEIEISSNENQRELLIPTMLELGCQGFLETDSTLLCYVEKGLWDESKYELMKRDIGAILRTISVNGSVRFKEIEDRNWNEEWERTIRPIEVGARLVIAPSWAHYKNDFHKIVVQIDPKMSFGTGYHETTRLTLRLLEKYLVQNDRVLDVGTGTGILAIAALKLGASHADGIDIDDWCIENASENAAANNVARQISISRRLLESFPSESFCMITANLTLNTNIAMLEDFRRLLQPGKLLLLSGLLMEDSRTMSDQLLASRFRKMEELAENEWIAIAASRKP